MSVSPEVQAEFDRLMDSAKSLGAGMADLLVNANPPPWGEDWFLLAHRNVIEVAGESYRKHHPDWSDQLVANCQLRVKEGFETRIKSLLSGLHLAGGAQ